MVQIIWIGKKYCQIKSNLFDFIWTFKSSQINLIWFYLSGKIAIWTTLIYLVISLGHGEVALDVPVDSLDGVMDDGEEERGDVEEEEKDVVDSHDWNQLPFVFMGESR